jgi:hypothetical protein
LVGNAYESIMIGVLDRLNPEAISVLRNATAPIWPGASRRSLIAIEEHVGA